jgi:hypothetical protein
MRKIAKFVIFGLSLYSTSCSMNVAGIKNARNLDQVAESCKRQGDPYGGGNASYADQRSQAIRLDIAILQELKLNYETGFKYLSDREFGNLKYCAYHYGDEALQHAINREFNAAGIKDESVRRWLATKEKVWEKERAEVSFFHLLTHSEDIAQQMTAESEIRNKEYLAQQAENSREDARIQKARLEHALDQERIKNDCRRKKGQGNRVHEANLARLPDMANTCRAGTIAVCSGSKQDVVCVYGRDGQSSFRKGKIEVYTVQFVCTLFNGDDFVNSTGYFLNSYGEISKSGVRCTP